MLTIFNTLSISDDGEQDLQEMTNSLKTEHEKGLITNKKGNRKWRCLVTTR